MTTRTDPAAPPVENPPADEGFTPAQEARLKDMLTELAGSLKPPAEAPPAPQRPADGGGSGQPPSGGPADLAAHIEKAVAAAMGKRDEEDRVAFLEAELDKLKSSLPKPPEQGWGRWILGGITR